MVILFGLTFLLAMPRSTSLSIIDCSMMACVIPLCKDTDIVTLPGECCPVCKEKPGTCPATNPLQVGICVEDCSSDHNCTGNQKCCSNGCGHICQEPIPDCSMLQCDEPRCKDTEIIVMPKEGCCPVCKDCSMACEEPRCKDTDIIMPEGECCPICKAKPGICPATNPLEFGTCAEDCSSDQDCTGNEKCCSNGCDHICVVPMPEKLGTCPKPEPLQVGTCVHQCYSDDECSGNLKCCSNGCGNTCQEPVPDCSMVACAFLVCKYGHYTPKGECCPVCYPDCSNVKCALPLCLDGYRYKQEGECCPSCIKDCSLAKCAKLYCKNGYYTPKKECCPVCKPDCSLVRCALPPCNQGYLYKSEGECCLSCIPDCSLAKCARLDCKNGLYTPQRECCPVCKPDCSRVTCLVPECKGTDVVTTPQGECCPVCKEKCSGFCGGIGGMRCPIGSSCNITDPYLDASGKCCIDEPEPETFCHMQAEPGPCEAFVKRFYFDPTDCKCKNFKYGGCGGNGNIFPSKQMCKKSCGSTCHRCSQPKPVGQCNGQKKRFYYDTQTNKCQQFSWGGCQPNGNIFKNKKSCKVCTKPVCSLPAFTGSCKAKIARFYYDTATGKCQKFVWGGCNSNGNNFRNIKACVRKCIKKKID